MMTLIIIIGGIVLIILLIIGVIVSSNSERVLVEKRLAQYLDDDSSHSNSRDTAQRTVITDWVSKRVEKTSFGDRIARDLSRADLKFKVGEYFVLIL
jgi:tight adherence protein B